jgi:hypothetical protein
MEPIHGPHNLSQGASKGSVRSLCSPCLEMTRVKPHDARYSRSWPTITAIAGLALQVQPGIQGSKTGEQRITERETEDRRVHIVGPS